MRFMPESDRDVVDDTLNLWQGFAVAARKPEGKSGVAGCRLFLDHGLNIICSGNAEYFDYLIKREAFIAQRRTRSEVAVGIKTKQEGTGKGIWSRSLNHLYGAHAMQVTRPEHVVGKHNKHLETLLRLTADEALFAGDPRQRDALYGLITELTHTIEPKFVDAYSAPNFINIDILSNADHFLQVSGTARRFFALTASAERMGDHEYFRKILAQLSDGGYEALLYHLLHEVDISDFNVRAVPKTAALAEQQVASLSAEEKWWYGVLNRGELPLLRSDKRSCPRDALHDEYVRRTQRVGHARRATETELGMFLSRVVPKLKTERPRVTVTVRHGATEEQRPRIYVFPALKECREAFAKNIGGAVAWDDPDADWEEEPLRW
jgi:hypothetical protein